jgi:hypothetical protein
MSEAGARPVRNRVVNKSGGVGGYQGRTGESNRLSFSAGGVAQPSGPCTSCRLRSPQGAGCARGASSMGCCGGARSAQPCLLGAHKGPCESGPSKPVSLGAMPARRSAPHTASGALRAPAPASRAAGRRRAGPAGPTEDRTPHASVLRHPLRSAAGPQSRAAVARIAGGSDSIRVGADGCEPMEANGSIWAPTPSCTRSAPA